MFDVPLLLILIILAALVFDFTNGAHDCANAIANGRRAMLVLFSDPRYSQSPYSRAVVIGE